MIKTASEMALDGLILQKFDELTELLVGLDDELANRSLPWKGSNSIVQILVHCCGMMRHWSSSVNLGNDIPRDRDTEFSAIMSVTEATQLASDTRESYISDIKSTNMQSPPVRVPDGREHYWTVTCESVLFHVLEELSQHLGQAQVTRDALIKR
ncbi:putative damage-inducible protein DinB [Arthrobacter sp. CAN_A212]|uniref:mycothiol transferase n=1 Tax=Arthrobacter sp. CAN_A212 TaxID=2787719 RepID=UPI0018CAFD71